MDWSRLSPLSIAAAVGAVAVGAYSTVNLIFPVVFAGLAWLVLHNLAPSAKRPAAPALAWQAGQLGWFLVGVVFAPQGLRQIWLDIVILAGLLVWFYLTLARAAAWTLIAYHGLSILVHLWSFAHNPIGSNTDRALVVHMAWRAVAIALLAVFIRRQAEPDPAAAARAFE